MKKIFLTISILLLAFLFTSLNAAVLDYHYMLNVEIVDLEERTTSKRIFVEKEEPLLEALAENFEIEGQESSFGYFITRIDFIKQDIENNTYIMIYVNDLAAQVGITQLELENNDTLTFTLEVYE